MTSLPSPRYILVHSHAATMDANAPDNRAHAFGPFDTIQQVIAFDAETPKDSCYRFAIPLVGPALLDVRITGLGLAAGKYPGAILLPPREDPTPSPVANLVHAAIEEMKRRQKAQRKAEKKAAKARQRAIDEANARDDGR